MENALNNQISVIQGPPGTGKTQTILNIIANLLVQHKSMQIVSSNNSAVRNILEKMASPKYALDFLIAPLGSTNNKEEFLKNQADYPSFVGWQKSSENQAFMKAEIDKLSAALRDIFASQERLAVVRRELDSLRVEIKYFEQYCKDQRLSYQGTRVRHPLKSDVLLRLWQECERLTEKDRVVSFWFKIKFVFFYGLADWKFFCGDVSKIVTLFQHLFYKTRKEELTQELSSLERFLREQDANGKLETLSARSMEYLHAILYQQYGANNMRVRFTDEDLWRNPEKVIEEYPVTLSSTFASRSSLRGCTYDYLIMDEASQVDLTTGALALSGARNAVIVGDLKQLPNVVTWEMKERSRQVLQECGLTEEYDYAENSFLKSVCGTSFRTFRRRC